MSHHRAQRGSNAARSAVNWYLGVLLGSFALVMPLSSVLGVSAGRPWIPILTTIGITFLWIGVICWVDDRRPVRTLTLAGGTYGVFAIGSGIALQGGLTVPVFAIPVIVLTNGVWGSIAGIVAAEIGRLRAE